MASLDRTLERNFKELGGKLDYIGTVLEWGFSEIQWEIQKQTEVLQSIEQTLRTPTQTQANELREMAETARARGALELGESYFKESLAKSRLDYRTHLGLAITHLEMNMPADAIVCLEESVLHAPNPFYKSYSYRLMGRAFACEGDYHTAAITVQRALSESPYYWYAVYDYAQYAARIDSVSESLGSLEKAIRGDYVFWYLSQKERNLRSLNGALSTLLENLLEEQRRAAIDSLQPYEPAIRHNRAIVQDTSRTLGFFLLSRPIPAAVTLNELDNRLAVVRKDFQTTDDYSTFLNVEGLCQGMTRTVDKANAQALEAKQQVSRVIARTAVPLLLLCLALLVFGYFVGDVAVIGFLTLLGTLALFLAWREARKELSQSVWSSNSHTEST